MRLIFNCKFHSVTVGLQCFFTLNKKMGNSLILTTDCCCLSPIGVRTNKPLFAIRKSFKVENAGELPLTVMSMNINGYKCQGFGFEVLQCRPFSLNHNSSSEITIA